MKKIGILNLQGAVSEHITMFARLNNVLVTEVKHPQDLDSLDGLVIPGGESTALSRLISENHLYDPIKQFANNGRGIFGTCAGLVLCAKTTTKISQNDRQVIPLDLIDITVERNGFGRQVDSFETMLNIAQIGDDVSAVFIRAPYIDSLGTNVISLASIDNHCVMAQVDNILVCSFHPELTGDLRIAQYFVDHLC